MNVGDVLIFIDEDKDSEYGFGSCFTIGNKYVVVEFGTMNTYSWVVVNDNYGDSWELGPESFKTLADVRDDRINDLLK